MVTDKITVGAIIQARLGSERLPGKALLPLPFGGGPTILEHVVEKVLKAKTILHVIVATTDKVQDDVLYHFCLDKGIKCFRGDTEDVLKRFYLAAEANKLDIIVRLTGDNPCIFPDILDKAVQEHLQSGADYTRTEGLPLGSNVEVISFSALARAHAATTAAGDREHVTPYFYNTGKHLFKNHRIHFTASQSPRLTIDYPTDYALVSLLFEKLYKPGKIINLEELLEQFQAHPWLHAINNSNQQRKAILTVKEEMEEAAKILQQAGLQHAAKVLENK